MSPSMLLLLVGKQHCLTSGTVSYMLPLMMKTKVIYATKGINTLTILLTCLALPPANIIKQLANTYPFYMQETLYAKGIGNCAYVHTQLDTDVVPLQIPCLINQIDVDNLWLQFDPKAHFHIIQLPIYEITNEIYLIAL